MKAKLNSLLDDVSGRMDRNVFARNAACLYLRRHTQAIQPDSPRQRTVRNRFTLASARWRTLTDTERDGWNRLAKSVAKVGRFGDLYNPSGHRLYLAVTTTRAEFALAPLDTAPAALPAVVPVAGFAPAMVNDGGALTFTLGESATALGTAVQVLASEPLSPGISALPRGSLRFLGTRTALQLLNADIAPLYEDKFGTPLVDAKVAVRLVPVSADGFAGSGLSVLVTVSN